MRHTKRKAILTALLLFSCTLAFAQSFDLQKQGLKERLYRHKTLQYTVGSGISTYFGDLKETSTDLWAKPSIQLGVQYRYNSHLHFRTELSWYRISGADSLNGPESGIYTRNLSFRADNLEWNIVGLYYLSNKFARIETPIINPYVFAGIGFTTNNPKAYLNGEWYDLRRLQTEGVSYSPVVLTLPVGVGITYHLNDNWDISAEYGYRVTFSDYLDDVSTTHLAQESITDPTRQALADRRWELGLPPAAEGAKRGNPSNKDWYLISTLKLTYTPTAANKKRYGRAKYR